MAAIKKILVANRGEIAVRVMRACSELSIASVAVFSDVDRTALHVRHAKEAYPIGPAAAQKSYLNIPKILEVARRSGAEAIHPGYGFLSENAEFARACAQAGIKFIGPTAEAMQKMGSKTRARQAMQAAQVPVVPGSAHGLSPAEAKKVAAEVGYPVMLKAAAGGGGKGMRLVPTPGELTAAYEAASSEALRAFGDGELYIEKFIEQPRHIEIQVMADEHGHCVYLGERECSIQRRHQKLLEESPSPVMTPELRQQMGEMALKAAKSIGYSSAGTFEFLLDEDRRFYFMEMNTRIQVEHPVTEMVTLTDIVRNQIRVAEGEPLGFGQDDVIMVGHAIECRINAESPDTFTPSPGLITTFNLPGGPGVRVDTYVYPGYRVPPFYDSMIAKVIVHARTRDLAIARMRRALDAMVVEGIKTTIPLHLKIMDNPDFQAGNFSTRFMEEFLDKNRLPDSTAVPTASAALTGVSA